MCGLLRSIDLSQSDPLLPLRQLLGEMTQGEEGSVIYPNDLVDKAYRLHLGPDEKPTGYEALRRFRQEDAFQFLQMIMDAAESDFLRRIFTFIHTNQTEFANCSHVSACHNPVRALQLTVDDSAVNSVQEAIYVYFADEVLNGRRCDAGGELCGTLGQSTQRHSVSDAPLAAAISLQRIQRVQTNVGQIAEGSELVCARL